MQNLTGTVWIRKKQDKSIFYSFTRFENSFQTIAGKNLKGWCMNVQTIGDKFIDYNFIDLKSAESFIQKTKRYKKLNTAEVAKYILTGKLDVRML